MSRKGKQPIELPKGVEVTHTNGVVKVKGPNGELTQEVPSALETKQEQQQLFVSIDPSYENSKAFHGLYRSLIQNMVTGTSEGFTKELEMIGVGYRAAVKGDKLDIQVGLSHPTLIDIPQGLSVQVEKNTLIKITGSNKQQVGQFAANVRSTRPPEPYQGKGIRYVGKYAEYVRRKAGKASGK